MKPYRDKHFPACKFFPHAMNQVPGVKLPNLCLARPLLRADLIDIFTYMRCGHHAPDIDPLVEQWHPDLDKFGIL